MGEEFVIEGGILERCLNVKKSEYRVPEGVHTVNFQAFGECRAMKKLYLSSTVSSLSPCMISYSADGKELGNPCLEYIEVAPENPYFCSVDGVLFTKDKSRLFWFPQNKKCDSYFVPTTVSVIGARAFFGAKSLKEVTITSGVKEIESDTFSGCSRLASIDAPYSLEKIGYRAFWGCSRLSSVKLPGRLAFVGDGAFVECHSLREFEVKGTQANIRVIDGVLFSGGGTTLLAYPSAKRDSVYTIPNGVYAISDYAFCFSGYLKRVIMPNTVKTSGYNVFASCGKLTEVELSAGLTKIESGFFENCRNLERMIIPEGIKEISLGALSGCKSLKEVSIPHSMDKLGPLVFEECGAIKKITIPRKYMDSVKKIFASSFRPGSSVHLNFI